MRDLYGADQKALKLCFQAHKDQVDKSGIPYVFHPFHLAEQTTDEATTVTALLHDVVEDTDYALSDLRAMCFLPQAAENCGLPTRFDRLALMMVSVDHLAYWRANATAKDSMM